jgi:hypothetical protein
MPQAVHAISGLSSHMQRAQATGETAVFPPALATLSMFRATQQAAGSSVNMLLPAANALDANTPKRLPGTLLSCKPARDSALATYDGA